MNPKITVIMSAYNGEKYLPKSVDSILGQSFHDFEFIIIDDASTDSTAQILRNYSYRDPRIRIITNEKNLGLTKSLNIGLRAAEGGYIARLDVGDTSDKDRLAKEVKFLDDNPEYIIVGTWARFVTEDGTQVGQMTGAAGDEDIRKKLIRHNQFVHPSIMIRKSALDEVGFYDETWRYAQEYELYFRLAKVGKMANLPEYLVDYLIFPGSITRKKNKEQIMFAIRARAKAIHEGQYSFWNYAYLILPFVGTFLPYDFKEKIKNILG